LNTSGLGDCLYPASFVEIISDFYMPVMSGFDLISRLRGVCPATPLLVVTAADLATIAQIPDAGADVCMQKPVRGSDLPEPICKLLCLQIAATAVTRLVWNAQEVNASA